MNYKDITKLLVSLQTAIGIMADLLCNISHGDVTSIYDIYSNGAGENISRDIQIVHA